MAQKHEPGVPDDRYARESFTFRRMTRWQVWAISIVSLLLVLAIIAYLVSA